MIIYNYTNMHFCNSAFRGTGRYGGYAAPYTPFHATELRLPIASRVFYPHPVVTAVLRLRVRSPTVSNGNQVAH